MKMRPPEATRDAQEARKKQYAIYARTSTSEGLEKDYNSLDAQNDMCVDYVRRQPDGEVAGVYVDGGHSGANIDRPDFKRLLADIAAGRIDVVVVYKIDRFSRSLLDFVAVMAKLEAHNVAFVSVTQSFSTADAIGKLLLRLLVMFSEFEREMIRDRTRDKVRAARRRGKWTGGQIPFGYDVVDGCLQLNEAEARVVREIFNLYLEQRSVLSVVSVLNSRGRVTKQRGAASGRVRGGRPWSRPDVLRVIRNPIYVGYVALDKERFKGQHEAIVSMETFERVQAAIDGAVAPRRGRQPNPNYLLRGILRCALCDGAYVPASTRRKGNEYRYYRCISREKRGTTACANGPLTADEIENYVVDQLRSEVGSGALALLADDLRVEVKKRLLAIRNEAERRRRPLPAAIAAGSDEARSLIDLMSRTEGEAKRLLVVRYEDVAKNLALLEAQLQAAERAYEGAKQSVTELSWLADCLQNFDGIWEQLTFFNRARFVRGLVRRIDVDRGDERRPGRFVMALQDFAAPEESCVPGES